ncbi:896e6216-2ffd-404b-958f-19fe88d884f7 [Sclerotinia trifoliorum]|uniref:896e6216-2ffd-404b-958f-19fe88d884f7 n=1 Tax=Sclerotinia trifoliorum TaxID=28548 RepID=A0A8H2ZTA5_9HELO|nr:896e6216-2ffd-404b-958f-19fe88d884f7 [Sclerotinia trifoliorum]
MSNSTTEEKPTLVEVEAQPTSTGTPVYDVDEKVDYDRMRAVNAEKIEHDMSVIQAIKAYPAASWWAFVMSCTIIMESYCVFLMGQFIATAQFAHDFGVYSAKTDKWIIEASWQSAFQCSGPVGAFIGVFVAGPITSRIGYRWATIGGLMCLNAFIFIFYFGNSQGMFFAAQILEGIPWGIFIANAPAYCAEIVPLRLRAPATQMLQMFWAIGAIIVGGITYHYQSKTDSSAYRVPIALQWIFPTPLAILLFIAPESPWWLVRKGRLAEAEKAIKRLGRASANDNPADAVAMIRRTIELETSVEQPSLIELWKGTDRYRTLIVCGVYASQNLTGNLIANQAVYFFKQAGMADNTAFALGLVTSGLQWIMVMVSWVLTTYLGRRTIYVYGQFINCVFLVALGISASVGGGTAASNAQASLALIVSVLFCLGPAPASWVIIGETSSVRLRPLTTGIGRAAYYLVDIPCIFLSSYMLNTDKWNLGGKSGYIWAGTAFVCTSMAWVWVPEMKNRSFREIDILFTRKVPARKWSKTIIDINDDE